MAVITLAEYKTLAGITGNDKDAQITALIPLIEDDIIAICNYDFGQGFPEGMKLYAAQMITYQMVAAGNVATMQSESIDGYSYSRAEIGQSGYPSSIETGLKSKWGRVSVKIPQAVTNYRDRRGTGTKALSENDPAYGYPGVPI